MFEHLKGVGVGAILSVGLHGAAAAVVLSLPSTWLATSEIPEPLTIEIEMESADEAEVVEAAEPELPLEPAPSEPEPLEPEPAEPEVARDEPDEAPSPVAAAVVPSTAPSTEAPGSGVPSDIEAPTVSSNARPDPRRDRRAIQALIDPTNVARSGFRVTGPGPSMPSGPAGLDTGRRVPTEAELEAQHSGHLRRRAMAKTHITREPVVPRRQSDGSYMWQGHMFTARINRDGSVRFQAADDVSYDLATGGGGFDLEGAIMRAQGQNPAAAEQARFMRETQELRDRLEDQHRAAERRRAATIVRGRVQRTWETTSRSPAARRRRIFRLWDEIAEDGSMDEARAIIVAWVAENLPEGSEDAYTAAELASLNGARSSTERFDPY